jgi:Yip1 domain
MLRVFFLLFEPAETWQKIAAARRGFSFILALHLLPFIAAITIAEGYGLMHWGRWQPRLEKIRIFSDAQIVWHFEILQAALFLLVVFIGAVLLHFASETFHGKKSFLSSFTVMAYGFSPLLLCQFLNLIPALNLFVGWGIGVALTVWIFYAGVPRVMQSQALPVHAFGVYLSAAAIAVMLSGLARAFTAMFLMNEINFTRNAITRALGHWLGQ